MRAGCGTIEYGIVRYDYGERTEMGGHVGGWIECRRQTPNILS